jgi:hypothetical protein
MPTQTKTRGMSHADSLAALNATAKAAATKEAKKKEREAIEKKEKEEKMKEVSEKKKRDAARSKAEQEAKENEAKKKEHNDIMDLDNEDEDSAPKALFVEEGNSPVQKRIKRSIGALKSKHRYTSTTASKKIVNLQTHTQFIDFGVTLTTNDKSGEFSVKIRDLLMNLQLLDETAGLVELVPRQESPPKIISQEGDIPTNFTQLGQFIVFSGDGIFKIQKKWNVNKGKPKHRDEDEDQVFAKAAYGTARITSTMESAQLIAGVVNEWEAKGGLKLVIKEIQAPGSKLVAVIYNVSHLTSMTAVKGALHSILRKAIEEESKEADDEWMDDDKVRKAAMGFTLKLQVPKTFKINTKEVDSMPWAIKQYRQAYHIEVALRDEKEMIRQITKAKDLKLMSPLGIKVHISECMTKESTTSENTNMMKVALRHGTYCANMEAATIHGFGDMNAGTGIMGEDDTNIISGFDFIKSVLKLAGGFPAIAEAYQLGPGEQVELVYPKCAEGHHMVENLKKNPAAFLAHSLKTVIPDTDFTWRMVVAICDAACTHEVQACEWDQETKTLSTPTDIADKEKANFDNAPWWENAFDLSALALNEPTKGRQQLKIFDLEQEGSVKTIHDKNRKAVSFRDEDDSASSSSKISLSSEYTTTGEATAKTPSPRQASTSVVTPSDVGGISSSAVSG